MRWLLALAIVAFFAFVDAKVATGTGNGKTQGGFVFLSKFAYDANPVPIVKEDDRVPVGNFEIDITLLDKEDKKRENFFLEVLNYSDNPGDWDAAYDKKVPCADKHTNAGGDVQKIYFNEQGAGAKVVVPILGGTRRRFRYIAVRNCNGFGKFDYKVHFQRNTDSWSREFGTEQTGINSLYLVFFLVYIFFGALVAYNTKVASTNLTYFHPIYKLYAGCVASAFVGVLFNFIHYVRYTHNGIGYPAIRIFGEIFALASHIAFIFLLILLSKGWAVSRTDLSNPKLVIGFVAAFFILYVIAMIVKYEAPNPADVSIPTSVIVFYNFVVALGFVFLGWFVFRSIKSMRVENNPVKRSFLLKLTIIYGIYLLSIPLVAVLSYAVDQWIAAQVVAAWSVSLTFLAFAIMLFLLWSSQAQKYFEFDRSVELMADTDFQRL